MKTSTSLFRSRPSSSKRPRSRNKWWRAAHGVTDFDLQWESVLHPDFLFVAVRGCQFLSRTGNRLFDLVGTKPNTIHVANSPKEARAFARDWIKKHSGRDYCAKACEKHAAIAVVA